MEVDEGERSWVTPILPFIPLSLVEPVYGPLTHHEGERGRERRPKVQDILFGVGAHAGLYALLKDLSWREEPSFHCTRVATYETLRFTIPQLCTAPRSDMTTEPAPSPSLTDMTGWCLAAYDRDKWNDDSLEVNDDSKMPAVSRFESTGIGFAPDDSSDPDAIPWRDWILYRRSSAGKITQDHLSRVASPLWQPRLYEATSALLEMWRNGTLAENNGLPADKQFIITAGDDPQHPDSQDFFVLMSPHSHITAAQSRSLSTSPSTTPSTSRSNSPEP